MVSFAAAVLGFSGMQRSGFGGGLPGAAATAKAVVASTAAATPVAAAAPLMFQAATHT